MVVEIGDYVEEGQLIARYVDDAALGTQGLEVEGVRARLPVLQPQIAQARKVRRTKLLGIGTRITAAKARLGEVRFLVTSGALPRASVVTAEDAVTRLR